MPDRRRFRGIVERQLLAGFAAEVTGGMRPQANYVPGLLLHLDTKSSSSKKTA